MIVAAVAINALNSHVHAQSQPGSGEGAPEYYAVYERAYHETSKLGIHPENTIHIDRVEISDASITLIFEQPVTGSAIINIYDSKGTILLNQYVILNGTKTKLPIYTSFAGGIQFLHVFNEEAESIFQFNNNQIITTKK